MKIEKKQLSDNQVELTIKLDQDQLSVAKSQALKELAPTVEAKGFRKGKVPPAVAEKELDANQLSLRIKEIAINRALLEAVDKYQIKPLLQPKVEEKKFVNDQELEFKAIFEIIPPIKLANYKKLNVKKETIKVSEKEVSEALKQIQKGFTENKDVKRAAKKGDKVIIDFEGFKDGKAFAGGKGEKFPLELGSNQFIPGFEEGIVGKKAGNEFDLELTFPKDYHAEDLKGQKVIFKTKLHQVQESILPEIDDKLAKKAAGFNTLDELKADIKKNLIVDKENRADQKFSNDLLEKLAEKSKMEVPELLIQDQINGIKQELAQNLAYQGLTIEKYLDSIKKTEDKWLKEEVKPVALKRAKIGLVLVELVKELKLSVSDEEVEQKIEQLKVQYANNKEIVKQLSSDLVKRDLKNNLLSEKAIKELTELNR